jgi:hypothetical protein
VQVSLSGCFLMKLSSPCISCHSVQIPLCCSCKRCASPVRCALFCLLSQRQ